ELNAKLQLPELRQVKQRIALRSTIRPLTAQETQSYIVTRLRIAKAANARLFTDRAVSVISRYARGIPRLINIVCEHSLLIGYAEQTRRIDHRIVAEAIRTIEAREQSGWGRVTEWRPRWDLRRWLVGAGAAVAAGTAGAAIWYNGGMATL